LSLHIYAEHTDSFWLLLFDILYWFDGEAVRRGIHSLIIYVSVRSISSLLKPRLYLNSCEKTISAARACSNHRFELPWMGAFQPTLSLPQPRLALEPNPNQKGALIFRPKRLVPASIASTRVRSQSTSSLFFRKHVTPCCSLLHTHSYTTRPSRPLLRKQEYPQIPCLHFYSSCPLVDYAIESWVKMQYLSKPRTFELPLPHFSLVIFLQVRR
jgi:hypothetical protein